MEPQQSYHNHYTFEITKRIQVRAPKIAKFLALTPSSSKGKMEERVPQQTKEQECQHCGPNMALPQL